MARQPCRPITRSFLAIMARIPLAVSRSPRLVVRLTGPLKRSLPPTRPTRPAAVPPWATLLVSRFASGDLVVEQINAANNAVTPTSAASPVFLSEYHTTGSQSSAVQSLPVSSTVTGGSNNPLTLSGTAASEGELSLSANGAYLVLAGYDVAAGGTTRGPRRSALSTAMASSTPARPPRFLPGTTPAAPRP